MSGPSAVLCPHCNQVFTIEPSLGVFVCSECHQRVLLPERTPNSHPSTPPPLPTLSLPHPTPSPTAPSDSLNPPRTSRTPSPARTPSPGPTNEPLGPRSTSTQVLRHPAETPHYRSSSSPRSAPPISPGSSTATSPTPPAYRPPPIAPLPPSTSTPTASYHPSQLPSSSATHPHIPPHPSHPSPLPSTSTTTHPHILPPHPSHPPPLPHRHIPASSFGIEDPHSHHLSVPDHHDTRRNSLSTEGNTAYGPLLQNGRRSSLEPADSSGRHTPSHSSRTPSPSPSPAPSPRGHDHPQPPSRSPEQQHQLLSTSLPGDGGGDGGGGGDSSSQPNLLHIRSKSRPKTNYQSFKELGLLGKVKYLYRTYGAGILFLYGLFSNVAFLQQTAAKEKALQPVSVLLEECCAANNYTSSMCCGDGSIPGQSDCCTTCLSELRNCTPRMCTKITRDQPSYCLNYATWLEHSVGICIEPCGDLTSNFGCFNQKCLSNPDGVLYINGLHRALFAVLILEIYLIISRLLSEFKYYFACYRTGEYGFFETKFPFIYTKKKKYYVFLLNNEGFHLPQLEYWLNVFTPQILSAFVHGVLIYTYHFNSDESWNSLPLYYFAVISLTIDLVVLLQATNRFRQSKRFFKLYHSLKTNKYFSAIPPAVRYCCEGLLDFIIVVAVIVGAVVAAIEIDARAPDVY